MDSVLSCQLAVRSQKGSENRMRIARKGKVLLCITRCSANGDPENDLHTQITDDSLSRKTDDSTRQFTDESLALVTATSNDPLRPKSMESNRTESSVQNVDSSTNSPILEPILVTNTDTMTAMLEDTGKTNLSPGSVVSETNSQQSVPTSNDNEASARHPTEQNDGLTTIADSANTFPADMPFVALVTDAPQVTTDNDSPKVLTSVSDSRHEGSLANEEPHVVSLVTDVPLVTDLVHDMPLAMANISPEVDILDVTAPPVTLDQERSLGDQPESQDRTTSADSAEAVTPLDSEPKVQTQDSTAQESRSQTTSDDVDHSTMLLTSNNGQSSPNDQSTAAPIPMEPMPTTHQIPILPVIVSETTSSPSKVPETETVAEDKETDLPVHQTTVFAPDGDSSPTIEEETLVEMASLHPLHGVTTVGVIYSSPLPSTQYETDYPSFMDKPDIFPGIYEEDPSTTAGDPSVAAINLTSPDDLVEEASTTAPDAFTDQTDMTQVLTTINSTVEETITSPELFPELTVPFAGFNTTDDSSSNESSISVVLEDLTPTMMIDTQDSSVIVASTNETSHPTPALTLDEPNKTHKDSNDLTDDEHSNAVTVIFYVPEPKKVDIDWDEDYNLLFRFFVVDQLNHQQDNGWPDLFKNNGSYVDHSGDAARRRKRQVETSLLPDDLVYISPAPLVDDRYIYVVFFIRNSSTPDPCDVVLGQKIVHALKESRLDLEQKMDMNVTRISTGIIMVKYLEPFFVRHALIFIVLLAVAFFCICVIIIGLLCLRCRNSRGNWKRNEFSDEKALKRDMKGPTTDAGDVNTGNNIENDEPQMAEKYGNGHHVISLGDDDGWVIPYDDLTPSQKAKYEFEDTKL